MAKTSGLKRGKATDDRRVQRDGNGRFIKGGSPVSPGRPALAAELPAVEGIKAASSAEKVAQALDKLFETGMKGNVKALTVWLAYVVGKPLNQDVETRLTKLEAIAVVKMNVDDL